MSRGLDLKSVAQTLFSNVFIQAITIVQGIILARVLGVEGRGEFAAIILWPTFFAAICQFGIKTGVGIIAAKFESVEKIYLPVLISALGTGVFGFLISYFTIPYLLVGQSSEVLMLARLYSLVIIINHLATVLLSIEHGRGDFKRFNILRSILNPIYLLIIGVLFVLDLLELSYLIYALLTANLIVLVIRFILISRNISFKDNYPIKSVFKNSFSFGLADLVMPLYQYLDKAILLWLLGVTSLGLYSVAFSSAGAIGTISAAIATVGFTKVAQDRKNVEHVVESFRMNTIVFLMIAVFYGLCLFILIPIVYGEEFVAAIWPAIILILAVFFQGQGNILEQALRGDGKPFKGVIARIISLVLMAMLGYLLSKSYGLIGICWAFVVAQFVFMIFLIRMFKINFDVENYLIPDLNDMRKLQSTVKIKLGI